VLEEGESWWVGPPRPVVQYVSLADASYGDELEDQVQPGGHGAFLSTAVQLGSTRLIDNVVLPPF